MKTTSVKASVKESVKAIAFGPLRFIYYTQKQFDMIQEIISNMNEIRKLASCTTISTFVYMQTVAELFSTLQEFKQSSLESIVNYGTPRLGKAYDYDIESTLNKTKILLEKLK